MLSKTVLSVLTLVGTLIFSLMTLSLLTLLIKATGTSPWVFEEVFEDCLAQDKIAAMPWTFRLTFTTNSSIA